MGAGISEMAKGHLEVGGPAVAVAAFTGEAPRNPSLLR
jgi:hypothetical protein